MSQGGRSASRNACELLLEPNESVVNAPHGFVNHSENGMVLPFLVSKFSTLAPSVVVEVFGPPRATTAGLLGCILRAGFPVSGGRIEYEPRLAFQVSLT